MKCRVMMQCPDSLEQSIEEMIENDCDVSDYTDEEAEYRIEDEKKHYLKLSEKWFKYQEMVVLEIDFDNMTCKVLET